jgi:hypothetical protein
MNLSTIEISPEEAQARLAEYEGLLMTERSAEDLAIAAGYRAAARGLPVIQLASVFAAGGAFPNGLPRLAIVRADVTECWVHTSSDSLVFGDRDWPDNRGALVGAHTVRVPWTAPPITPGIRQRWGGRAVVPSIPPRHRPNRRRIRGCHILWEVEEWSNVVPKDPALLRHIRGDLWSVLAVWDLTELERAVLSQRSSLR